jgi:hypothetical protein
MEDVDITPDQFTSRLTFDPDTEGLRRDDERLLESGAELVARGSHDHGPYRANVSYFVESRQDLLDQTDDDEIPEIRTRWHLYRGDKRIEHEDYTDEIAHRDESAEAFIRTDFYEGANEAFDIVLPDD